MRGVVGRTAAAGLVMAATLLGGGLSAQTARVPYDHPDRITFGPTTFQLPDPAQHAVDLGQGLVAFVAEDPVTTTVELTALIGASRLDDPAGKAGLAEAVAFAMSRVGPAAPGAAPLADVLHRMDARLSASVDNEHTRVSLSFLNEDLGEAIELFAGLLRRPRLDDEMLATYHRQGLRPEWDPDDPRTRPGVEFSRLIYGDHPAGRRRTRATLAAITVEDLTAFHRRLYVPNNIVLAVSGGLDRAAVISALERSLFGASWMRTAVNHADLPAVPAPDARTLHVFDVDRRQAWAVVGHLGVRGRAADRAALEVANYILGGNGAIWKRVHPDRPPARGQGHFRARLYDESRTVRGLTNDTSSYVPVGFRAPTPIYAVTSGRPESIPYLLRIIDEQWRRIGQEASDLDVEIAKGALTEGYFQMRYAGAHATALSLAEERFFEGGHDWYRGYVEAIRAVTRDAVLGAARSYYRAEELVAVLVGPLERIQTTEHPQYTAQLSDFGAIVKHDW